MKKRISCKVIKSIPLRDGDVISSRGDSFKIRSLFSYFDIFLAESRAVIYTSKMEIVKDSINENLSEQSMDFYA